MTDLEGELECHVRLITINDVYELDLLSNFTTARRENEGGDLYLALLPGDFLAPSSLSSLDRGFGMVDVLNRAGMDIVCFGNHEADIPLEPHLYDRIKQSKFLWINSNMPTFKCPTDDLDLCKKLPSYHIITVKNKRIAFLGLTTEDPSIWKPTSFGGCKIEPVNETMQDFYNKLKNLEKVDVIIPLTHQLVEKDRELAKMNLDGIPLIIGGHDHEVYIETYNDCTIVKTGMDAKKFAICDLKFYKNIPKVKVKVSLIETSTYSKDTEVHEVIQKHQMILKALEESTLCHIPEHIHLSSKEMRLHPTTMGTFICTVVREALYADCCLIPAGNIRGNKSYENTKILTYGDIRSEVPFDNTVIVIVMLPGRVINEMISYTREFGLRSPPIEKGGYLQCDDRLRWDKEKNFVKLINKEPLDLEYLYTVAISEQLLHGMDEVKPLMNYIESDESKLNNPSVHKTTTESGDRKSVV